MKSLARLTVALIASLLSSLLAQGPLTPPGAPAPTMKTLDQLEPRTDVLSLPGDADYHHIITQAGSYYLSGNLAVTKTNGIYVRFAEGVTIDMGGFEIRRTSGSGGDGITISAVSHRCGLKNGSIKNFAYGIHTLADANFPSGCAFRDLSVSGCTSYGLLAGTGAVLESCRAHNNSGSYAIYAAIGSALSNCVASFNTADQCIFADNGSVLNNCAASYNTATYGIRAGFGSTLSNCTATYNTATYGILADSGSALTNCAAQTNGSAETNSAGIGTGFGVTLTNCSTYSNYSTAATATATRGMGFFLGQESTIQNCAASTNEGDGIAVSSECVVRDNVCVHNGTSGDGAGIHVTGTANRIEGNNVANNDRGIEAGGIRNFIARNTARTNTLNYVVVAGNRIAQIVVPAVNAADINGANSGSSDGFSNVDPWANFSY